MQPELDNRREWDEWWRSMRIETTGRVRSVEGPDLEPGEILIVPGIPGERPSRVRFRLEGHILELEWEHGRLSGGVEKPLGAVR